MAQTLTESPADRIARKDHEKTLRKNSKRKEQLWRSLFAHACGILTILAEFSLKYKIDLRDRN